MSGQTEVRSEHCINCGDPLDDESNWRIQDIQNSLFYCTKWDCQAAKPQVKPQKGRKGFGTTPKVGPLTEDQKRARAIGRYIDQDRIERLVIRIEKANVERSRAEFIDAAAEMAREENKDLDEARKQARELTSNWTAQTEGVRRFPPEDVVKAIINDKSYGLQDDAENGDTPATYHIAFNKCGYDDFPLDEDGLPARKPGPRTGFINPILQKADRLAGDERLGITKIKVAEARRNYRPEHRVIQCKSNETYMKILERMNSKRYREDESMRRLAAARKRTLVEDQTQIDQYWQEKERVR